MAQYVGVLDNPWTNVADAIEGLWHNSVKTDKGIEEIIKTLDVKLSESIMHAMSNGIELEKKVCTIFLIYCYIYFFVLSFMDAVATINPIV